MKILSAFLFCAFLPGMAFAQSVQNTPEDTTRGDIQPAYELEPVIVTSPRHARPGYQVPYAVDQITETDIQRGEAGLSLEETLRSLPGVMTHNRNNPSQGDRISMRGIGSRAAFGVRGIKMIQDGVPLTTADGQSQLNNVDLVSTGQIEVIRGPSSSLYGNAAGGVILLETEKSPDHVFLTHPRYMIGSDGLRRWNWKINGQAGRTEYFTSINAFQIDGFRDHAFVRSHGVNLVLRHAVSDRSRLSAVFNYSNAPYQFNPSSLNRAAADTLPTSVRLFVQRQGASKKVRQGQGGLTFTYRGEQNQTEITVYGLGRTLYNPIPGQVIDLGRKGGGLRGVYSRLIEWDASSLRLTSGADIETQSDDRKEYANAGIPNDQVGKVKNEAIFGLVTRGAAQLDQDERVIGVGPFAELEYHPRPDIILTAGGRYDHYRFTVKDRLLTDNIDDSGSRGMSRFSPMMGATYRPLPLLAFYGNFSTAFQTPTTTELSNQPTREGGFNPDIHPERLYGFETGVKAGLNRLRLNWDAVFFGYWIRDMLVPFQINDPASDEIYYRNAGKTRNFGVEFNAVWTPHSTVRASVSYTAMAFQFSDFQSERSISGTPTLFQLSGKNIPGVPPQHLFIGVAYTHPLGVFLETNLQWIDRYFANDFNGAPPGSSKPARDFINRSYALVDLRFGAQPRSRWPLPDFFVGINNLFDKRYNGSIVPNATGDNFFEPSAGRTWYAGFGLRFGVSRVN